MSIKTENDLFDWLKVKIPDLQKSKDKFSFWDCYSKILNCRIELKCRRKHYDTLLIEKKKYDSMINKCNNGETLVYLNSTPKGIYGWNLRNLNIEWQVNELNPATTDFNSNQRIKKEVGYLNIKQAKNYERL